MRIHCAGIVIHTSSCFPRRCVCESAGQVTCAVSLSSVSVQWKIPKCDLETVMIRKCNKVDGSLFFCPSAFVVSLPEVHKCPPSQIYQKNDFKIHLDLTHAHCMHSVTPCQSLSGPVNTTWKAFSCLNFTESPSAELKHKLQIFPVLCTEVLSGQQKPEKPETGVTFETVGTWKTMANKFYPPKGLQDPTKTICFCRMLKRQRFCRMTQIHD